MKTASCSLAVFALVLGFFAPPARADDLRDLTKDLEKRAENLEQNFQSLLRHGSRGDRYLTWLNGLVQGYSKAAGDLRKTVKDEKGRRKIGEKLEKVMEYASAIDQRIYRVNSRRVMQSWQGNVDILGELGGNFSARRSYGYGERRDDRDYRDGPRRW